MGARRAWGPACILLLFFVSLAPPAHAVPAGTHIENTAWADFNANGMAMTHTSNTVPLVTAWPRTSAEMELLQYAPSLADADSMTIAQTSYNPDGTASDTTELITAVYPAGSGTAIDLGRPVPLVPADIFHQGEPLFFQVKDFDQNIDPLVSETVWVMVSADVTQDSELLLFSETGPDTGIFMGYIQSSGLGPAQTFNGVLDVAENHSISVLYTDAADAADSVNLSALMDPFGLTFDSTSGEPVDNIRLTLVTHTGDPATVYGDDGISTFPATIISGGTHVDSGGKVYDFPTGRYRFPFVIPGSYRLVIEPLSGFSAPSTVPTADLQKLDGAPFAIAEPGSRGEIFVLNPGPVIRMDIPVDPIGLGLWLKKTADRTLAAVGDFVPYTLTVGNHAGETAQGVMVSDRLPQGFRYRSGSARLDGRKLPDPEISKDGRSLAFSVGDMEDTEFFEIRYVTQVTAGARPGEARNLASAESVNGYGSNTAMAAVTIKEDLFRSDNFIAGRVVVAPCGDFSRNPSAEQLDLQVDDPAADRIDGVAGVRLYLEDGTYVVTDRRGRYHFEGISSGSHVVQLDRVTLPAAYEIAPCVNDSRWAENPYSRFVDLQGGTLWQVDFHLQPKAMLTLDTAAGGNPCTELLDMMSGKCEQEAQVRNRGASDISASPRRAGEPVVLTGKAVDNIDVETLSPGTAWLMPGEETYPHIPSIKLAVRHDPTEKIELLRNDNPVSPLNFDGRQINKVGTVAVSFWRGVDLEEGDNHFTAIRKDTGGREIGRLRRTVHYSGPPVTAELVPAASYLVANGKDAPVIALRLIDNSGHPARFGMVGEYAVQPPYQSFEDKYSTSVETVRELARRPLSGALRESRRYTVGRDGVVRLPLQPTTQSGRVVIKLPLSGQVRQVHAWLQPEARQWILVGLAEGTAGYHAVSGNMENLGDAGQEEDYYRDGRLAFFAKGRIKGKWLLTAAFDSERNRDDPGQRLFQTVDPDAFYTLYGDNSQQQDEAASIDKLYLKIERERFYALYGDFDTGMDITELSRYSRRMNGLKSEYNGEKYRINLFATDTRQAFVKDEIRGDGTSGIYMLSKRSIVAHSETVTIETRDRFHSEVVVSSEALTRFVEYSIDYNEGTLFFKSPIYSRDENFNPVYIVVDYESEDYQNRDLTYGGRTSMTVMDRRMEVGASMIHEGGRGAEGDLAGLDSRIDLGGGIALKAEVAASRKQEGTAEKDGAAYLAEVIKKTAGLDAKAYFREQESGFGLGQQKGSETAVRKSGAEAVWRFRPGYFVSGEVYQHENLATDARRNAGEALLQYNPSEYALSAGVRQVEDRFADGTLDRSTQALLGASRRFMKDRLQLRAGHEQLLNNKGSADYPTRSTLGADYRLTHQAALFGEHEMTWNENLHTQVSRAGIKATPWSGGTVGTSAGREHANNSERLFANLGLNQTWGISDRWRVDGGLDRSQTVAYQKQASINANVPAVSGADEDFTAISLGAEYTAHCWSWTGRVETRYAENRDKWAVTTGIAGEVRRGLGLSAGLELFDTRSSEENGDETLESDLRLSMAWRPDRSPWIVFDRLDYKIESKTDDTGKADTRRVVNNLNASYKPRYDLQLSLQYGAKYVFDTIDGRSYDGYTDLTGIETRYSLNERWDMGVQASLLHVWNAGQFDYRTGASIGYCLLKNTWVSLGYNFTGFSDEDFSAADFTAKGPYIRFRFKFDQQSVREMVDWFGR